MSKQIENNTEIKNKIILADIKTIKLNPDNPRIIKDDKYKKLVKSIQDFPQMLEIRPIVVNSDMVILGGNMRLRACQEAGLKQIPIIRVDELTEEQQKEFIIKDNIAFGEWNWDCLGNEWDELKLDEWGLDTLGLWPEMDNGYDESTEDNIPEVDEEHIFTQKGDLYLLGNHRLLCGDSTDEKTVSLLMDGNKADFMFTSPPYLGMRDYEGGEYALDDLLKFINVLPVDFFAINLGLSRKDGEINCYWNEYIKKCNDNKHKLTSWNIWSRAGKGGSIANMSAMFPIEHEFIFVFGGKKEDVNKTKKNKSVGKHTGISNRQKDGTTKKAEPKIVKEYGRMGSVFESCYANDTHKYNHPAMFPVTLPEEYIKACSNKNDIIYEPFTGSGTTIIASEKTERKCYGMELSEKYCDVIVKRYMEYTGRNDVKCFRDGKEISFNV